MTDAERISRGQRAESALSEFLGPAFDVVIADYTRRVTEIAAEKPWEVDRITKLAAAIKIAETARQQIKAVVSDGKLAEADMKRARQLERLPTAKRRMFAV